MKIEVFPIRTIIFSGWGQRKLNPVIKPLFRANEDRPSGGSTTVKISLYLLTSPIF
jgi:hypothetical protein